MRCNLNIVYKKIYRLRHREKGWKREIRYKQVNTRSRKERRHAIRGRNKGGGEREREGLKGRTRNAVITLHKKKKQCFSEECQELFAKHQSGYCSSNHSMPLQYSRHHLGSRIFLRLGDDRGLFTRASMSHGVLMLFFGRFFNCRQSNEHGGSHLGMFFFVC